MLAKMSHETLTSADLKAIGKARGLAGTQAISRERLEHQFLSEVGVADAVAQLEQKEVVSLHLLSYVDDAVDISFFERLYGSSNKNRWYRTFTQRYQDVLKQVRTQLVRKGLLLMTEDPKARNADSKMERWRFRFPVEFVPFLPPLIEHTERLDVAGEVNHQIVRQLVTNLTRPDTSIAQRTMPKALKFLHRDVQKKYTLALKNGALFMGDRRFRAESLREWQLTCWSAAIARAPRAEQEAESRFYRRQPESPHYLEPDEATRYALSRFKSDTWIPPTSLTPVLETFCKEPYPDASDICHLGWEWGLLERYQDPQLPNSPILYRLHPGSSQMDLAQHNGKELIANLRKSIENPDEYLNPISQKDDDHLVVDLNLVPYHALEQISFISKLSIEGEKLLARPDLIKIGNSLDVVQDLPLFQWLQVNSSAYAATFETVRKRWGKQVIHENLLLAKINDVGLKVAIERAFKESNDVQILPNDFIAFAKELLPQIERVVTKTGYVVKTRKAEG